MNNHSESHRITSIGDWRLKKKKVLHMQDTIHRAIHETLTGFRFTEAGKLLGYLHRPELKHILGENFYRDEFLYNAWIIQYMTLSYVYHLLDRKNWCDNPMLTLAALNSLIFRYAKTQASKILEGVNVIPYDFTSRQERGGRDLFEESIESTKHVILSPHKKDYNYRFYVLISTYRREIIELLYDTPYMHLKEEYAWHNDPLDILEVLAKNPERWKQKAIDFFELLYHISEKILSEEIGVRGK